MCWCCQLPNIKINRSHLVVQSMDTSHSVSIASTLCWWPLCPQVGIGLHYSQQLTVRTIFYSMSSQCNSTVNREGWNQAKHESCPGVNKCLKNEQTNKTIPVTFSFLSILFPYYTEQRSLHNESYILNSFHPHPFHPPCHGNALELPQKRICQRYSAITGICWADRTPETSPIQANAALFIG